MRGAQYVTAPPPNRAPSKPLPDPRLADELLVDENQRMAEEKRRAKLADRMRDRCSSSCVAQLPSRAKKMASVIQIADRS
jgi:hypothetical protein